VLKNNLIVVVLIFKGIVGHLIDVFSLCTLNYERNPHSYTKFKLIDGLGKKTGAKVFIETGTFRGVTALRCSETFESVYTVEIDQKFYEQAKEALSYKSNINCLKGDALKFIHHVIKQNNVQNAIIFFRRTLFGRRYRQREQRGAGRAINSIINSVSE
jgi:hypothetical protein